MNNGTASVNTAGQIGLEDAEATTEKVLKDIQVMLNAENIYTNDVQQQMLASHV
ncbi:MAG: glycine dehydrogenase, partial [Ewingella sp.]|nr:glycine dehydrogenase [Ewingella sp.]